ncbi:31613_t:CDS:1, partial [Racocetra persica]
MIEPYEIIEDNFDNYLGDFNYEIAENLGTSTKTFSSTTIRPTNIQT